MGQVKTHSGARSRPNALSNLGRRAPARLPARSRQRRRLALMCLSASGVRRGRWALAENTTCQRKGTLTEEWTPRRAASRTHSLITLRPSGCRDGVGRTHPSSLAPCTHTHRSVFTRTSSATTERTVRLRSARALTLADDCR